MDSLKIAKIDDSIKEIKELKSMRKWEPDIEGMNPKFKQKCSLNAEILNSLNQYPHIKDKDLIDKNFWIYLNVVYSKVDIFYTDFNINAYIVVKETKRLNRVANVFFTNSIDITDISLNSIPNKTVTSVMTNYDAIVIEFILGDSHKEEHIHTMNRFFDTARLYNKPIKLIVNTKYVKVFEDKYKDFIKNYEIDDLTTPSTIDLIPKRDENLVDIVQENKEESERNECD